MKLFLILRWAGFFGEPEDAPDGDVTRMLGGRYARYCHNPSTALLKMPIYRIVSIESTGITSKLSAGKMVKCG